MIEYRLALAMAGQVAVGLAPGDGQEARAVGALNALGLMLINATKGDEETATAVRDTLNQAAYVTIEDGLITIALKGQDPVRYDAEGVETPGGP